MYKALLYPATWTRTVNLFPADSNSKHALSSAIQALLERPAVSRLLRALTSNGEQARIVGGAVRDTVMGRAVGDIDFATTAVPAAVIQIAKTMGWKAIPTGIEHGTVTIMIDGASYEVTTLRRDVETDGRRAVVAFSRDFKEDAFRRDFTINALSLSRDGIIHDYATGISDAKEGLIRFMGEPETRIREDYLRILRFFRFQSTHGRHKNTGQYEDEVDLSTADFQACALCKTGLNQLSRERIRQEILKLLGAPGCLAAVRAMKLIGIWDIVLPGIDTNLAALHHLMTLENATTVTPNIMLRLAAFSGPHFSSVDLQTLLVLSNREHKRIQTVEKLAADIDAVPLPDNRLRTMAFLGGKDGCMEALLLTHARISAKPEATAQELQRLELTLAHLPLNPFTSEAVAARGIRPGPLMGRILKKSLELWLAAGLPSDAPTQSRILDDAVHSTSSNSTVCDRIP
jgi:poly(A) polymerase